MKLTIDLLKKEATEFCKHESNITHEELFGVTDGKAIGTYIEHKFEEHLKNKYDIIIGSSAKGIDLPEKHINTDIKVTSDKKPQNSSPFKNIEQKIYGLGHNLLIFVYEKVDMNNNCYLDFKHCIFIEAERSGDYHLTKIIRLLIKNNVEKRDIIEVLKDYDVPGDNQSLDNLAKKILSSPPNQGYLTISNAFQWRVKYNNIINLDEKVNGIYSYNLNNQKESSNNQIPLFITDYICKYLRNELKINPKTIIELNLSNNFLKSVSTSFINQKIYSYPIGEFELNNSNITRKNIKFINKKCPTLKFDKNNEENSFLIIGALLEDINTENNIANNTYCNNVNSQNIKEINTTKKFKNVNNAQHTILKIINEFKNTPSTIAFLCENRFSQEIFKELIKNNIPYSFIKQITFDSLNSFKINDNICLFILQFGGTPLSNAKCDVCNISSPSKVQFQFGYISDEFHPYISNIPPIDGKCPFNWRQGVKHDCAKVLELTYENNQFRNKNNEIVKIENTMIYPLLKSSQLKKPIISETSKYILITQKKIKQDTTYIKNKAPKTWNYLTKHKHSFDIRKSSCYNNSPDFSISGIGNYLFKKFKIAISGFNKNPIFSLVYSEKSMMLDDACYYISFDNYDYAYTTMLILNSKLVKKFLKNIAFLDSKRPYSKKVLRRIDIKKCLNFLTLGDLKETENELKLDEYITQDKLNNYIKLLN